MSSNPHRILFIVIKKTTKLSNGQHLREIPRNNFYIWQLYQSSIGPWPSKWKENCLLPPSLSQIYCQKNSSYIALILCCPSLRHINLFYRLLRIAWKLVNVTVKMVWCLRRWLEKSKTVVSCRSHEESWTQNQWARWIYFWFLKRHLCGKFIEYFSWLKQTFAELYNQRYFRMWCWW